MDLIQLLILIIVILGILLVIAIGIIIFLAKQLHDTNQELDWYDKSYR